MDANSLEKKFIRPRLVQDVVKTVDASLAPFAAGPPDPQWKYICPRFVFVQDMVRLGEIVEAADIKISGLSTHDDTVTPIFAGIKKCFYLDGVACEAHESLSLGLGGRGGVQTKQKPYDAVVTYVPLRAHTLTPEVFSMG